MSENTVERAARDFAGGIKIGAYSSQYDKYIGFCAGAAFERERAKVLVDALQTIHKEVDDDGMGAWLTGLVGNALAEYEGK